MKFGVPVEVIYGLFIVLAVPTVVFLLGKGTGMLADFNAAHEKDNLRFEKKKLCRGIGVCFGVIELLLAVTAVFWGRLPEWYGILFCVVVGLAILVVSMLANLNVIFRK